LVKRSRFSFLVFWSTYVPYRRKKLTFAISSPDELLSNALKILAFSFIHSYFLLHIPFHSTLSCLLISSLPLPSAFPLSATLSHKSTLGIGERRSFGWSSHLDGRIKCVYAAINAFLCILRLKWSIRQHQIWFLWQLIITCSSAVADKPARRAASRQTAKF